MKLTNKQKSVLRSKAQTLDSIVKVGDKGIIPNVIESLEEALIARELVKISVAHPDRDIRKEMMEELADSTDSILVNIIGKTGLYFKENSDNPVISSKL